MVHQNPNSQYSLFGCSDCSDRTAIFYSNLRDSPNNEHVREQFEKLISGEQYEHRTVWTVPNSCSMDPDIRYICIKSCYFEYAESELKLLSSDFFHFVFGIFKLAKRDSLYTIEPMHILYNCRLYSLINHIDKSYNV